MNEKETLRLEMAGILKIDAKVDYYNSKLVNAALGFIEENKLNSSPYGKAYEKKVREIAENGLNKDESLNCYICKKPSEKKLICPVCRNKITSLVNPPREKETEPAKVKEESPKTDYSTIKDTANTVSFMTKKTVDTITERVNVMLGGEGVVDLRLKDLFSQVLKRHTKEEADELFICGTQYTTPEPERISSSWPKPWLFSRVAVVLIVTFYFLLACYNVFGNSNAIPGIMFIGSLAIPFSMLIFLFEINAPRNISIFQVVFVFMIGGAASLFVTLILYQFNSSVELNIGGAIFVGVVEEVGKILILAYMMKRLQTTKYILNGLLIGGAVGAGFAVFESAGYAFSAYIGAKLYGILSVQTSSSVDNMVSNIIVRGFLSPGSHIAWAAMEGAFLVIVLNGEEFKWSSIWSSKFLYLCILPVAMHAFWDMPILTFLIGEIPVKMITLEVLAIIIIFVILHRGLEQINSIQSEN